jgi:PASTA domain
MADIKVPGLGEVPKPAVYGGALFIVGAVVVVYIRHRNAANSAAANSASSTTSGNLVTDPAGNQCAALDPASGYCPGTQEDEQYQEQASAGIGEGYDEYPGGGAGQYLVTDANGNQCVELDPATGLCPVATGTGTGTSTTTVTTNAQWVVEAEEQLGNSSTVQAALGYALSGSPVTAAQKNIFMEAVGLLGPPPQGYPPLNVTGSNSGGGGAKTVDVPRVEGMRVEEANAALSAKGLNSHLSGPRKAGVAYYVNSQTPGAGKKVASGSTVDLGISTKK